VRGTKIAFANESNAKDYAKEFLNGAALVCVTIFIQSPALTRPIFVCGRSSTPVCTTFKVLVPPHGHGQRPQRNDADGDPRLSRQFVALDSTPSDSVWPKSRVDEFVKLKQTLHASVHLLAVPQYAYVVNSCMVLCQSF
jgi:hypothetical protein